MAAYFARKEINVRRYDGLLYMNLAGGYQETFSRWDMLWVVVELQELRTDAKLGIGLCPSFFFQFLLRIGWNFNDPLDIIFNDLELGGGKKYKDCWNSGRIRSKISSALRLQSLLWPRPSCLLGLCLKLYMVFLIYVENCVLKINQGTLKFVNCIISWLFDEQRPCLFNYYNKQT